MKSIKIFHKKLEGYYKGIIASDDAERILIIIDSDKLNSKEEEIEIINKLLKKSSKYWSDYRGKKS